ncbi:MAG: tripartite tricarboxylate transporter substrate-binding protein [Pseudomonadota bacterium]
MASSLGMTRRQATLVTISALAAPWALAQGGYPQRPVRVVVPFPAGGTLDGPARTLTTAMARLGGQQFIIDNRAGAGGTVGAGEVARATPDGYTLLVSSSSVPISAVLYRNPPFDTLKSYRHIGMFAAFPTVFAINPAKHDFRTLAELLADARAHPGKLTYASPGVGTASHFAAEMLKSHTQADLLHVPYRGAAPALTDVLGGQVDVISAGLSTVAQHLRQGKLRALAVSTAQRSPLLPDVPAVAETAPGYEFLSWLGLSAPAATPAAVVARLADLMKTALAEPETRRQLLEGGIEPVFIEEKAFTQRIAREQEAFAAVVKQTNMQAE